MTPLIKTSVNASEWDDILRLADEIINACQLRMVKAQEQGKLESALHWAQTAASFIVFGGTFGRLASVELERLTVIVGNTLPMAPSHRTSNNGQRILHVVTQAYELFGHTKLCRKWIELDPGHTRHDVVLLDQYDAAPSNLQQAVEVRGGKVTRLDRTLPMLKRAQLLRELAYAEADVVVLHVHPHDLLANVAFGVPGGPPVVYVNHADHEFWVGGAVADLVLDIRESGQEWTRLNRDIPRTEILPIPLEEDALLLNGPERRAALRREVREAFGIAPDDFLLLTIGSARKYEPMNGLSFLEAAEAILNRCPKAKLLAVGPRPTGEWQAVAARTGGRLLAIGNQSDLGRFHAAADLYLEGMPAGSLTALLEVCLGGLACVRAPAQVRPPHASDGSALAPVPQPADVAQYIEEAVGLVNSSKFRQERAELLQNIVRETHCAQGWSKLLAKIVTKLPKTHLVHPDQKPQFISRTETEFKLNYAYRDAAKARAEMLATFVQQAVRYSQEARRMVERVLPETMLEGDEMLVCGETLFGVILPELKSMVSGSETRGGLQGMKMAPLARWLIQYAAEDGRRFAAWRLGARLAARAPGLWRDVEFRTGVARSLPGMLTLTEMIKSRRA